jgi:predicted phage tail protein
MPDFIKAMVIVLFCALASGTTMFAIAMDDNGVSGKLEMEANYQAYRAEHVREEILITAAQEEAYRMAERQHYTIGPVYMGAKVYGTFRTNVQVRIWTRGGGAHVEGVGTTANGYIFGVLVN